MTGERFGFCTVTRMANVPGWCHLRCDCGHKWRTKVWRVQAGKVVECRACVDRRLAFRRRRRNDLATPTDSTDSPLRIHLPDMPEIWVDGVGYVEVE